MNVKISPGYDVTSSSIVTSVRSLSLPAHEVPSVPKPTVLHLKTPDLPKAIAVIRNAIDKKIARLEKESELALARLKAFEDQYQVSSADFAERFTAEDLPGQDLEYIE
ncbi:hypothetical protein [Trichothermofontia sp.]